MSCAAGRLVAELKVFADIGDLLRPIYYAGFSSVNSLTDSMRRDFETAALVARHFREFLL